MSRSRGETFARPSLVLILAALLPVGCGEGEKASRSLGSASEAERSAAEAASLGEIVDDEGRSVPVDPVPRRLLSLVPSATETLLALGLGDRLVGRTDFDTVPPIDTLPSVGGGLQPSLERIAALDPDLVIRFAASSDRRTPERLEALGIRHLAVRPEGIDEIRGVVRLLGSATGRTTRADSLVARIDRSLASVRDRVEGRERPRVAFVLGGSPPWVAGPGSFLSDLIEVAGGQNVFSDLDELYGPVSPEAFVSRQIDLLFAVEGEELGLDRLDLPVRRLPPIVRSPGPDLGEAARIVARSLHPDAFR